MKRDFLKNLGIEDNDIVDKIMTQTEATSGMSRRISRE